ncbi:tetracycline resistance MFS efflux pump [Alicyclobacillus cellulosilyticus]|uniref:Tetracycline resistance MFS efflux pump n=1 Tax=Alicyclobacillus cellulosilyticus TaxID=1003997 RepID=A0A917K572_9BACL|nr:MFS transporter [Alicyclobacillus cellulosilyticus]GGJ01443.1 tetracycline resistance MFS efflux pump [Alicyclobacillus cellulosilyticus]
MRRLSVILLMLLTVFIGFGLIIPVLPLMITDAGARAYHLGLMLAAYSAVSFFVSPWWGRLSDRIGRKPVLIIGLVGFAAAFAVFGLAKGMLWLMYVSRLVGGGFSGAVTATAMAYIADVTGVEDRTKGMAMAGMVIGLGFIIGPAVGGALSSFGIAVPFFAAAGLALLNALVGAVLLQESLAPEMRQTRREEPAGSRWAAFSGPLKYLYIVDFIAQFCISSLEGVFQLFEMAAIGATARQIGYMFAISGLCGALVQGGIVRNYVKHGREVPAMYAGLIVSGIGLLALLLSVDFWTATLFMTVFGVGNTVIKPTLTSLITKETKVGQGQANGLLSSMDSLARIIGPILSSSLFEVHHDLPFVVTAAVAFAGIALVAAYRRGSNRHASMTGAT